MDIHDVTETLRLGPPLAKSRTAILLLHGRGSSAEDIAGLAESLAADDCTFLVPSARRGTWYPQRFFAPLAENEPWLTSALSVLDHLVQEIAEAGLVSERLGLVGFSQGGCLALEYAARHPRRYAFVAGLSSALIGPLDTPRGPGDLQGTPTLLGCAEQDAHIPLEFVEKSAATLTALRADVSKQLYPGSAHTIYRKEIEWLDAKLAALEPRAG